MLALLVRRSGMIGGVGEIPFLGVVRHPLHQLGAGGREANEGKPYEKAGQHERDVTLGNARKSNLRHWHTPKPPREVNLLAQRIMEISTGQVVEEDAPVPPLSNRAGVARRGQSASRQRNAPPLPFRAVCSRSRFKTEWID